MGRIGRAALIALVAAAPALAEEPAAASLLDRCWTPQTLTSTAGEAKPARARNKLDLPGLRQEPVVAATPIPEAQRGSIRSVELPPGEKLIALISSTSARPTEPSPAMTGASSICCAPRR